MKASEMSLTYFKSISMVSGTIICSRRAPGSSKYWEDGTSGWCSVWTNGLTRIKQAPHKAEGLVQVRIRYLYLHVGTGQKLKSTTFTSRSPRIYS